MKDEEKRADPRENVRCGCWHTLKKNTLSPP